MKIYITCEGGLVQAVSTDTPALEGVEYVVIDYDTEGSDFDERTDIVQTDGSIADAIVGGGTVDKLEIEIVEK